MNTKLGAHKATLHEERLKSSRLRMPAATETVVARVVQEVRQELVKTARKPAKDTAAAKAREAVAALEASNGKKFCRVEFPDSFIQK